MKQCLSKMSMGELYALVMRRPGGWFKDPTEFERERLLSQQILVELDRREADRLRPIELIRREMKKISRRAIKVK